MSRIAKKPIQIPTGVELSLVASELSVKGKHGTLVFPIHKAVTVLIEGQTLQVQATGRAHPMVGTTFKLIQNMIKGVSELFERKIQLVGVGYRAKVQGDTLELSLGYSNPVFYKVPTGPAGIKVSVPSPTEIILQSLDNQLLGETESKLCKLRRRDAYKGKGIRRAGTVPILKQTKKKK